MKYDLRPEAGKHWASNGGSHQNFFEGKVFGFDVGTGSIGYAVRKGSEFLDAGVLICDSEGSDLSKRRELRRQRRTLRSKKYRRQWFGGELAKLGLGRPSSFINDPVELRCRALDGEKLEPEKLHAALSHLFRRRGYIEVPWANRDAAEGKKSEKEKEEGVIKEQVKDIQKELAGRHPCQLLRERRIAAGKSPTDKWGRKIYWQRDDLEAEFRAIVEAQAPHYPQLVEKADWLLYGDTQSKHRKGRDFHVYFKNTEGRNPGVLGMKWPRFDNRGPALDALQPVDEDGRPVHVVRKDKEAFSKAQWELALMNFRVQDAATRKKIDPREHFPEFVAALRQEWEKKGKVTEARLKKLAEPWAEKFLLVEEQKALTPEKEGGRARYSSPTLNAIREAIDAGGRVEPPQPILQRSGETPEEATNRFLAEIKHPLVRHRLVLFRRLLAQMMEKHGTPDIIVLEAVRSLALGRKAKNELNKRNEQHRKDRENAREELKGAGKSVSRKAITRYRLWKEAHSICPFCKQPITQEQLLNGEADIEHLVPRSVVDCNELYNLTVGHVHCNREVKGDRTPHAAFSHDAEKWEQLRANAEKCFRGQKLEIFLSPDAETLIEQKTDLQHTAYIARMIRQIVLVQLGWVGRDGRDPTIEKGNKPSSCFQVTNGQLTHRLRGAWGLNQILHPLPQGAKWEDLSEEEQRQYGEKNRGDLRHHVLDAMVIACTLPWLAHRTVGALDPQSGEHGWWELDSQTQRSKARNPIFPQAGEMYRVCKEQIAGVEVRHHVSRSKHQQAYATTLYARKAPNTYVAREVFTTLTPKNLKSIWPKELGYYCEAAWRQYCAEADDIDAELKKTKGLLPESFTERLCFSQFQKWRAEGAPEFVWPKAVKIPMRNVSLISVKDDTAVMPFSAGTHAYVKRTGFKEVQIFPAADGKGYVPVFIPYWRGDKPFAEREVLKGASAVTVIRRGMIVNTVKAFSAGQPPGKYRVLVTGQSQLKLLPHHVANKEEAITSFGLGKKGLQPYWPDFIHAMGYELPHSSSAQS